MGDQGEAKYASVAIGVAAVTAVFGAGAAFVPGKHASTEAALGVAAMAAIPAGYLAYDEYSANKDGGSDEPIAKAKGGTWTLAALAIATLIAACGAAFHASKSGHVATATGPVSVPAHAHAHGRT